MHHHLLPAFPNRQKHKVTTNMAARTAIQENLISKNKEYVANFTQGHLELPPAKKYAVGQLILPVIP